MFRCIRVPKYFGETARRRLISSGMLDPGAKIRIDNDSILIPILADTFGDYDVIDADLEPTEHRETDYRNVANIPEELKELLPNSYDIIGDIAVVKFPDELVPYAEAAGDALLRTTSSLRAVMMDLGVKGELRVRDIRMIAGSGTSETIHKEFGVTMIADPGKAYFNPRLSTERMRIASMVKDNEIIIDMFAGVAPFPLVIAKHSKPSVIYSIDLNEDAAELMKRNIKLNRASNIIPLCGDASILIKDLPSADRIIMNLPQIADSFLHDALSNLKDGGTVHMHKIMERASSDETITELINEMKKKGYSIRIDREVELKTYSPTMSVYVLDIIKGS
ncbi:MAG: class I SAM-dependent methyltransferase family protein [Methanomassiliicoccaceae archaeon]|jgi:tRNA (guanine37-N1)-methyltransferase|nr:class I SAM-dependent methyltransferase family protein [Methanomassiliicoccaceae archaeon]